MARDVSSVCFSAVLLLCILQQGCCEQSINITFGDITQVVMFEGQQQTINVSIVSYGDKHDLLVSFESEDLYIFDILNKTFTSFEVTSHTNFSLILPVTIKGKHIGISELRALVAVVGQNSSEEVTSLVVKIKVGNSIIQGVLQFVFYVPLMFVFFMMGAGMDLEAIADCFKHPIPIFIGFACQFAAMPALALGIGKLVRLEESYALGLLMAGCSPGGKISNDLTILLDGDFVLSVTMTACSTTLALAMMPLNVFIYTRFITESNITTPYVPVIQQIAFLMIPIVLGLLFKYKFPKVKDKVLRVLKPVVAIIMFATLCIVIPFGWYVFLSPPTVYLAALLLPLSGGVIGAIMAKVFQLSNHKMIAISMETGVQNGLFAIIVLRSVYPAPESDLAMAAPNLTFLMTVIIGSMLVGCKMVYFRFIRNKGDTDTEDILQEQPNGDEDPSEDHCHNAVVLTGINTCVLDQQEAIHCPKDHQITTSGRQQHLK